MGLRKFLTGRAGRIELSDEVEALLDEKEGTVDRPHQLNGSFLFEADSHRSGKSKPWHSQQEAGMGAGPSSSARPSLRSLLFCTLAVAAFIPLITQFASFQPFQPCGSKPESHSPDPDNMGYPISNFSCLPTQPCWPSVAEWGAFNQSIGGMLKVTIPWAAPCYWNSSSTECVDVQNRYMDSNSRTEQYGSFEFLDWETCGQSSCLLASFHKSASGAADTVEGECKLGRLSEYYVEAHKAQDIIKTLQFVRDHGIRLSIKNTGHDYFGRSNSANSLALWTHNMKDMKIHKTYQPKGCKTQYKNVGEIGAGAQAEDVYTFFDGVGMLATVGAVSSVGIAGGFGQGGGHGPLGPTWGLMVDNAIEFDVITADGKFRTINECSDPDLFWAMRGGGGGTFAVLVKYRFQAHPAVPLNVYQFQAEFKTVSGKLDLSKSKLHRDIITTLARNQTLLSSHGVAGYNFLYPDHMVSLQLLPSTDTEALKQITADLHDFLTAYPDLEIKNNSYHIFPKFHNWAAFTQHPSIAKNGLVGLGLAESGRLIPKTHFESEHAINDLVDAVIDAMHISYTANGGGSAQLYATTPVNNPDNSKTGVNPAWRGALWQVIMGGIWVKDTPISTRKLVQSTISASIEPFKRITPDGGAYFNEGDWTETDWQHTFFGSNYEGLLEVKRRYDPQGLFNCWKCVGWTGYADPMYSCYGQSGIEPIPTLPHKSL